VYYRAAGFGYAKSKLLVQVKAREVLTQRFVTVVNYVEIASRKDFDSVKDEIMEKSESVRWFLFSIAKCTFTIFII